MSESKFLTRLQLISYVSSYVDECAEVAGTYFIGPSWDKATIDRGLKSLSSTIIIGTRNGEDVA